MSMPFTFITFTNYRLTATPTFLSPRASSGKQKNKHLLFIAINGYHSMTLRNADPDLNKNRGGSTDLGQKIARIDGFLYPYSPPSYKDFRWDTLIEGGKVEKLRVRELDLYLNKHGDYCRSEA